MQISKLSLLHEIWLSNENRKCRLVEKLCCWQIPLVTAHTNILLTSTTWSVQTHLRLCHPFDRPFLQPARTKQGSHGLGRTIINRKAKEAKVDRKTLKYAEEAENLRSVTHERDLDEFLNNASLADADFTAGECLFPVTSAYTITEVLCQIVPWQTSRSSPRHPFLRVSKRILSCFHSRKNRTSTPSRPRTRLRCVCPDDLHGRPRHRGRSWRRMSEKTICTGDEDLPSKFTIRLWIHLLTVRS
jgi:hypothetical protein